MTRDQENFFKEMIIAIGTASITVAAAGLILNAVKNDEYNKAVKDYTSAVKEVFNLKEYNPTDIYLSYYNNSPKAVLNGTITVDNKVEQIGFEYTIPCSTQYQQKKYENLIGLSKVEHYVDVNNTVTKVVKELTILVNEETPIEIYGNYNFNADENTL